jgi:uncharacterized protein
MSHTRYHLSGATPTLNECLYTNLDRPLLKLVADTVKVHDMTFMACFSKLYKDLGLEGHRSCKENVVEAMSEFCSEHGRSENGVEGRRNFAAWKGKRWGEEDIPDPFNVFQNTPYYTLKPLGNSRKGDFVEWQVLDDAVVGVSCCPYDVVSMTLSS